MRQIKQVYEMRDQCAAENRPTWNITAIARHFKVSGPTSTSPSTNVST